MPPDEPLKEGIRVRKKQCESCVFRPESKGGIVLPPHRRIEIQVMLLEGGNQLCHHDDNETICHGGRQLQLDCFYRMGRIAEPTNEALAAKLEQLGIEPATHIKGKGKCSDAANE